MDKKRYIILSIIILVIVLGLGITYAWYTWSTSSEDETRIVTNLGAATVYYESGSNITADIMPVSSKEEGIIKEITVKTDKNTTYKLSFNLYLDILDLPDIFKHESFKYAIYKDSVLVKEGNFTETFETCTVNSTNHIVLINNESITTTTSTYTLYLWIDGENYTNPSEMQNKIIKLKLHADGVNAVLGKPAVQYITKLYEDASKTTVTNNSITYNYASSVSLMNDRLGGTTIGLDDGNIRYYGANPNNYIDIGDIYEEDTTINNWERVGWSYENQTACYDDFDCDTHYADWGYNTVEACTADIPNRLEGTGYSTADELCGTTTIPKGTPTLYRIIGIFKDVELADGSKQDLVKVVRAESIGDYSWDTSDSSVNSGYGINEWSQADLMKLLNPGYESETVGGSLWWNSGTGTCYNNDNSSTTSCDFTGKGLTSNVQNKIASVVWNTGGWDDSIVYSNQMYSYERGTNVVVPGTTCSDSFCNDTVTRTTSWTGKVALMYPSDYGYATDFNKCTEDLYNYDSSADSYACRTNDWLFNSAIQWLLTPFADDASHAWLVDSSYVDYGGVGSARGVRPVFFLNSEAIIESGNGSSSSPYRLSAS